MRRIQLDFYTCWTMLLRKTMTKEMKGGWSQKGVGLRSESNVEGASGAVGGRCGGAQYGRAMESGMVERG